MFMLSEVGGELSLKRTKSMLWTDGKFYNLFWEVVLWEYSLSNLSIKIYAFFILIIF